MRSPPKPERGLGGRTHPRSAAPDFEPGGADGVIMDPVTTGLDSVFSDWGWNLDLSLYSTRLFEVCLLFGEAAINLS